MTATVPLPRRIYKNTEELSIIGFGGIVVCSVSQKEADRYVAEAIGLGINYFDVAPSYFEGEAELKLGNALRPWRKGVFLACKTTRRDGAGARQELETSLKRAHTDHFDLYQFLVKQLVFLKHCIVLHGHKNAPLSGNRSIFFNLSTLRGAYQTSLVFHLFQLFSTLAPSVFSNRDDTLTSW